MHLSKLARGPKAPFRAKGNNFDTLFVTPQRKKKAWDGQDKDAFFRDKYAHVHAKQLKQREQEQQLKQERLGKQLKDTAVNRTMLKPSPKRDFYETFTARLEKNRTLEFLYGTNAVRAALKTRPAAKLYSGHKYEADIDRDIVDLCRSQNIPIVNGVPAQHLQIMSSQGVHNKLILETQKRDLQQLSSLRFDESNHSLVLNEGTPDETSKSLVTKRKRRRPLGLFIDQVTDTHNMGALLRSALWFGVDFVAFSSRNSAPFSPAVVKASSGASEFVSLWEVSKPLQLFENLKEQGWAVVASAPNPEVSKQAKIDLINTAPDDLRNLDKPTLLVVGSEGDGIRTSLLQRSTHATSLESSQTDVDSLNVSVATAILLNYCT